MSDNIHKNIIRNFNIIIGVSFILLVSAVYITYIFNINIPLGSDIDLESLEIIIADKFVYHIKIFFSFLIPLSFFIFIFLFTLNPIDVKSILISFFLIFFISIYLYKLPYNILLNPFENLNVFIGFIINIAAANFIMIFIVGMSYIKYNIKDFSLLYDFYTMIFEIIIWNFLMLFIISLIITSVSVTLYFNDKIEIKRVLKFLMRNDMKNLKIFSSVFAIVEISLIYFSYLIYNKMSNTKLSISVSRVLSVFIDVSSVLIMIFTFKYNLLNNHNIKFLLLFYFLFMIIFILNTFLFRIDKDYNTIEHYIYILSNIFGIIYSSFLFFIIYQKFSYNYFVILNIIISINFLYNIIIFIMKKYKKIIFLYNYIYIIFFIIILFY